MHGPNKKRKPSTEINIYREICRNHIASHPTLHPNFKVVLMRLTDYVNRHSWDAFVGEATLAKDCNVTTRSIRRAIAAGKRLGLLERTKRGNQYIGPSHHVFKVRKQESAEDDLGQCIGRSKSVQRTPGVPLTSGEHLNNLRSMEEGSGSGERAPAGLKSEPKTKWTRPIIYGERLRTSEDSYELEQIREVGFVPRVWWRPARSRTPSSNQFQA
jgi:hypothetical protein